MKIANTSSQLWGISKTSQAKDNRDNFAEIFNKLNSAQTAKSGRNADTISITNRSSQNEPQESFYFAFQGINKPISIEEGLSKLTDEQRAMLNLKYNLNDIEPGSDEYNALMDELHGIGVLSRAPIKLPPNLIDITFRDDGTFHSCLSIVEYDDKSYNPNTVNWFDSFLNGNQDQYLALLEKKNLTEGDKAYKIFYESQKNIYSAIKDIFSEQIKSNPVNI